MRKQLELFFISMIVIAILFLGYNYYKSYSFKHNPLPQSYMEKIKQKEQEVLANMQKVYGIYYKVPLIVTDKIQGRLYGLTAYENNEVKIYLNKKVMQESFEYMIDSVIAHEYAHALMFRLGYLHEEKAGHSKKWQEVCQNLGGKNCQQYVDTQEIILSKIPFKH